VHCEFLQELFRIGGDDREEPNRIRVTLDEQHQEGSQRRPFRRLFPDILAQLAIRESGPVYALVDQSLEGVSPEFVVVEHVREDVSLHVGGFYFMLANVGRFPMDLREELAGVDPVDVRSELIGVNFWEADNFLLALFIAIARDSKTVIKSL
jgi:hypothetical protein